MMLFTVSVIVVVVYSLPLVLRKGQNGKVWCAVLVVVVVVISYKGGTVQ